MSESDNGVVFSLIVGALFGLVVGWSVASSPLVNGRELCECCGARKPEATGLYVCEECKSKARSAAVKP